MKPSYQKVSTVVFAALLLLAFTAHPASLPFAQAQDTSHLKGTVETAKVHGRDLEGNLSEDSPERDVFIYLPPSYKTEPNRRYPVVYMLHGFTSSAAKWFGAQSHWINLPGVIDKSMASGASREMIVVMPNAYTRFQGSMYSNSVTTGNWETFVADDIVAHVDSLYRTIPTAAGRGLAGHSMGGYGAMRIGMKNPDVFSSIYLLSPCCMAPRSSTPQSAAALAQAEAITNIEEFEKAAFGIKAIFASAAAWAPNPVNPPFYLDLPTKNGEPQPLVLAKLAANAPLAMIDQYIANLKEMKAIAFDAGDQDAGIAATIKTLDQVLNDYEIEHLFEIYDGNHTNRVAERIETKALPFFSENLSFDQGRN
jgi:enterochelin esterase-like enzyme